MKKISRFNLSLLDDNSMYNINDLITCFHYFGSGVTFNQITKYFEDVQVIQKNEKYEDDNYNYFVEYIRILEKKGLTYLGLINFVANNNGQSQPNQLEWEGLLAELDINFNGNLIQGVDIKRVFSALFNTESELKKISDIEYNYEKYKQLYPLDYDKIGAFKDEIYQPGILSKNDYDEGATSTSILMSKGQSTELHYCRNKLAKKFVDSFEKEYNIK